jgi:hypothetical protein
VHSRSAVAEVLELRDTEGLGARKIARRTGLHWTVARPYTVYVSRKADVARLDEFVGPKS